MALTNRQQQEIAIVHEIYNICNEHLSEEQKLKIAEEFPNGNPKQLLKNLEEHLEEAHLASVYNYLDQMRELASEDREIVHT